MQNPDGARRGRRRVRRRRRATIEEEAKPKPPAEVKKSDKVAKQQVAREDVSAPVKRSRAPSPAENEAEDAVAKKVQVKVFVEETLRKGVQGLIAEFKGMRRMNDFTLMTEFVQQNPLGRNRYKDVGCLDNFRVILTIGNVQYIHANYVSTPVSAKRFICTQAPLPKTCPDFWNMVVQEKSVAILMLCNFIEQNAKKCAEYFPTQEGPPMAFEGDVYVSFKKQEMFNFPFETRVRIQITHLDVTVPGQPAHTCAHYHWLDWPDRGVPEADLAPIALLGKLKDSITPIIVHCSAGIGRTGSIVLIQHALELLQRNQPLLEISTYLIELRKQRNNSIQ
ncbi:Receptor-type tyrosine-protein phosphatase S, partial [Trichostrongylus colubriformis]